MRLGTLDDVRPGLFFYFYFGGVLLLLLRLRGSVPVFLGRSLELDGRILGRILGF